MPSLRSNKTSLGSTTGTYIGKFEGAGMELPQLVVEDLGRLRASSHGAVAPIAFGAPTLATGATVGRSFAYAYVIVARNGLGQVIAVSVESDPDIPFFRGIAPLTAAPNEYNIVSWLAVAGAATYDIYRTRNDYGGFPFDATTAGLIGTTALVAFNDTGMAGDWTVPPSAPVVVDPADGAMPAIFLDKKIDGTDGGVLVPGVGLVFDFAPNSYAMNQSLLEQADVPRTLFSNPRVGGVDTDVIIDFVDGWGRIAQTTYTIIGTGFNGTKIAIWKILKITFTVPSIAKISIGWGDSFGLRYPYFSTMSAGELTYPLGRVQGNFLRCIIDGNEAPIDAATGARIFTVGKPEEPFIWDPRGLFIPPDNLLPNGDRRYIIMYFVDYENLLFSRSFIRGVELNTIPAYAGGFINLPPFIPSASKVPPPPPEPPGEGFYQFAGLNPRVDP